MVTKYDLELNMISPSLNMLPWISSNYEKTGLLFIGESDSSDGVEFHKYWKREWIEKERIINIGKGSRFLNNIDKTILGDKISEITQKQLWNNIAFTNVVQRPMNWLENKNDKPSDQDFLDGWNTVLQVLLILKPKMVIKWGIAGHGTLGGKIHEEIYKGWSLERLEPNYRFLNLKHESGFTTQILFMQHPSWPYFSSNKHHVRVKNYFPEISSLFG